MRSTDEMIELILKVAKEDDNIRAVTMVGSRANTDAEPDEYQDYDITLSVRDVSPYWNNLEWVREHFGEPLIVQTPETMELLPPVNDGNFVFLVIFEDMVRMDINFESYPYLDDGEPAVLLLDKDGEIEISRASAKHWWIKEPTRKLLSDCTNEFWWCMNNVGKGIARNALPYAMWMWNGPVRDMLEKMLEWLCGARCGFDRSAGKHGRNFPKFIPSEYERYLKTYCRADKDDIWRAIDEGCSLFSDAAREVAEKLGFEYNSADEAGMRKFLAWVRER